jgi:hypothetical protein
VTRAATREHRGAASVAAVRAFTRQRRGRRWLDWYVTGFGAGIAAIYLGNFLARPLSRLTAHPPGGLPHGQAEAGLALVIAAGAGTIAAAQALGPLTLSPADASWLLLSPLRRRALLRRPVLVVAAVAALAGALLGILALAMAGPYITARPHGQLGQWLGLAALTGAGLTLAAVLTATAAQPTQRPRRSIRFTCACVAGAAVIGAVAGEHWTALPDAVAAGLAGLTLAMAAWLALAGLVAAVAAALATWRALAGFPAGVLRADSARAGTTRLAVAFLNIPLLTWIAEDAHWRGRALRSRPWPAFLRRSPAMALAWADWRRLARRPGIAVALAAAAVGPALAAGAVTGQARGLATAAVLLAGAIAAGTPGTAALRRDANDPALRRMLGVGSRAALAARAVLPALLAGGWMTLALALLVSAGALRGWQWPLLGALSGPGLAAAALRIARTSPIDAAVRGPDTALGSAPPWLVTRALSVLLGLAGGYPALVAARAVIARGAQFAHASAGALAGQAAVSAVVLGGYLLVAGRPASSGQASAARPGLD